MKAYLNTRYGPPSNMYISEVPTPSPKSNEVLVKVKTASLNASDYEFLTGSPAYARIFGPFTPNIKILGTDVAGIVEKVGAKVSQFKPGDEVYGDILGGQGGFAEYTCAKESKWTLKSPNISFEVAAAIPQAASIAIQGIRDKGKVQAGHKILINGAGGGSGSYAIQLAKMFGAEVTAVDNESKLAHMLELGADHVIDYRTEDFTQNGEKYDLIYDLVAQRPLSKIKGSLADTGKYYLVGGNMGPLLQAVLFGPILSSKKGKTLGLLALNHNLDDFRLMSEWIENGKIKAMIDTVYSFEEIPQAMRHLGEGKALGKIVVRIE